MYNNDSRRLNQQKIALVHQAVQEWRHRLPPDSLPQVEMVEQALQELARHLETSAPVPQVIPENDVDAKRYRQLLDLARVGVWALDAEAKTTFVNPRMAKMLGCTVEEILGQPVYCFIDEEELGKTRTRLEQLLACSPTVLYSCRPEGDYGTTFVSANVKDQLGYSPEEFIRDSRFWMDHIHPEDRENVHTAIVPIFTKGTVSLEYRFRMKDGTYRWMLDQMRLVRDSGGKPMEIIGHCADISERKQSEFLLRESEERFRQMAENINQVFWMADLGMTEIFYISPAYERIWERSCRTLYDNPKSWLEPIHPEDVERVHRTVAKRSPEGHRVEYRIVLPDGSIRWIMDSGFPVRNEAGEIYRFAGIAEDITERKRIEADLREHQVNLSKIEESQRHRSHLDAIMRSIGEGILTIDGDMRATYANEALRTMCPCFGTVRIGTLLKEIPCPCDGSCFAALDQILKTHEPVLDFRVNCRKGRKTNQVVILNGSQLQGHNAGLGGAVLTIRDVTRIEELEKRLILRNSFGDIVGKSRRMQEIYGLIESLANLETTVLITGESGTGKELVAEALHRGGIWSAGALVKVNCAALPEGLLESELFGHVRGAFTGAVANSTGRFEAAEGGTILLDEIGDISPLTQLKLLRVLEQKEFERIGESKTRKASVRVVAATNADLQEKVRRGMFREDLLYRLKVMVIHLPPLRERTEDIPLLADSFICRMRDACGKNITGISGEVMDLFMAYRWPGNIRELKYTLEHACIVCRGGTIGMEHLPKELSENADLWSCGREQPSQGEVGAAEIVAAVAHAEGNKARAARVLGISRSTLYRRIEQFRLDIP